MLPPDVNRNSERVRVTVDLFASAADGRNRRGQVLGKHGVDVELVGVAGGQAPGALGAIAADHDRDARLLDAGRFVDRAAYGRVRALVRRAPPETASCEGSRSHRPGHRAYPSGPE